MKNKPVASIIALSFLAIMLAAYLAIIHYVPSAGSICSISNNMDCDKVNKSSYSNLFYALGFPDMQYAIGFDIPVALLGLIAYLILFSLGMFQ